LDIHAIQFNERGDGVPAWEETKGLVIKKQGLAGMGLVDGVPVQCISPQMQVLFHTGYKLPDIQIWDLELLYKKFGVGNKKIIED